MTQHKGRSDVTERTKQSDKHLPAEVNEVIVEESATISFALVGWLLKIRFSMQTRVSIV